jgi:hypothetical protein
MLAVQWSSNGRKRSRLARDYAIAVYSFATLHVCRTQIKKVHDRYAQPQEIRTKVILPNKMSMTEVFACCD